MLSIVTQAFLLGLATAPFCAAACAPVFLPVVLSHGGGRRADSALALGQFLLGRLVAYAAVGLLIGWLGQTVQDIAFQPILIGSRALLGLALVLYAASETRHESGLCRAFQRWGRAGKFPLVLGVLTGVNICPPFVTAVTMALGSGGPVHGLLFFVTFFIVTSLVLLPMLVVALTRFLPAVQSIGRAACGLAGLIFLCLAARAFGAQVIGQTHVDVAAPRPAALRPLLPEAAELTEASEPARHLLGRTGGRDVGLIAFSTDLAPEIIGFNGPVPVAVALDTTGAITGVRVLESRETPGYVRKIYDPEFARTFRARTYSDPLTVGRDVDNVTGATVTAKAVADGVRLTARRAAVRVLDLASVDAPAAVPHAEGPSPWHLAILLVFVVAVIGETRRIAWLRYVVLAAAFLYLGVWQRTFFSVRHVADLVCLDLPGLAIRPVWYILALPALGLALVMGRVYCGWMCPFGALSELLGRVFSSPLKMTAKWDRRLRRIKYLVLVLLPVLYAVFGSPGVMDVEPFSDVFAFGFLSQAGDVTLRLAWLVFLAIASLLVFRFFCRYLCPAGAAMAFLAQHRIWGRVRPDGCTECGECGVSCPRREGNP